MLYYGYSNIMSVLKYDTIVYNITSYKEGLVRLNLMPPCDVRFYKDGSREFDMYYADWILSNDGPFFDFFTIVYNLYIGNDIFLVMDDGDWSENIIESLLKLIQQRYGYNGCMIDSFDSYVYAQNNMSSRFESFGLMNLDVDKDRYSVIMVKLHPELLKEENYDN